MKIYGICVLHINNASGNNAAMIAHIKRTIDPKNADKERTHLNEQLVDLCAKNEKRATK